MVGFTFHIAQLGQVKDATVDFDELTILTGDNGTGKTYIASAIFSFFDYFKTVQPLLRSQYKSATSEVRDHHQELLRYSQTDYNQLLQAGEVEVDLSQYLDEAAEKVQEAASTLNKNLGLIFGVAEEQFKEDSFSVTVKDLKVTDCKTGFWNLKAAGQLGFCRPSASDLLKITLPESKTNEPLHRSMYTDGIARYVFDFLLRPVYFSTSERSGIVMFQNTIDINRSRLLESVGTEQEAIRAFQRSRIPHTTSSNLDMVRDALDYLAGEYSEFAKENPQLIAELDRLIGAKFVEVDQEIYLDYGGSAPISMKTASSSIRSLIDLNIFIKYVAQPGAALMVDEPELNLHPRNQIRLARLLVRLVKAGIRVFISTHSDFIIREIGLCVMLFDASRQENLHKEQAQQVAENYGAGAEKVDANFARNYGLNPAGVRAYRTFSTRGGISVEPMEVNTTSGIAMPVFDNEIIAQNQRLDFAEWGIGEVS